MENLSAERIRLILFSVEICWLLVAGLAYYYFEDLFWIYLPFVAVVNGLTLLPLPGIMLKLKKHEGEQNLSHYNHVLVDTEETSGEWEFGAWEKTCVGYFVITNGILLAFLTFLMVISF